MEVFRFRYAKNRVKTACFISLKDRKIFLKM